LIYLIISIFISFLLSGETNRLTKRGLTLGTFLLLAVTSIAEATGVADIVIFLPGDILSVSLIIFRAVLFGAAFGSEIELSSLL